MFSEQDARQLLHQAADTIEVEPAGPIAVRSRRPVWGVAAATAAVVLVLGSVVALVGREDPDPDPTPPALAGDDGSFRLGPDQVPSVFGYSADAAVTMLEDLGLDPKVVVVANECDETLKRAIFTKPTTGTVVEAGTEVRVLVPGRTGSSRAFCVLDTYHRDDAWALIDYANGRGPKPDTTADVDLEPLLESLEDWSSEVGRYDGRRMTFPTPELTTTKSTGEAPCGKLPARLREGDVLALSVALPAKDGPGVPWSACQTAYVGFDDQGRINDFYIPEDGAPGGGATPADVVGNTVATATQRLEAQGFIVEPISRTDCQPVGLVTAQQPFPYDEQEVRPGMTVFVAFTESDGPCVEDSLDIQTPARVAAEQLVTFARGGPLPPVADEIDLYLANELDTTITAIEAQDPKNWMVLSYAADGPVAYFEPQVHEDDECHVINAELPDELTDVDAWSRSTAFGDAEPRSCADSWEAQLWLDEDGRIFAVNLLLGDPDAGF